MASPRPLNWGILATGGIALTFARDLTVSPTTRDIHDFTHRVVAAASSSSASRAEQFLKDVDADKDGKPRGVVDKNAKAYGSYEELVKDENVDVIYVATPHSHHYQNVRLCVEAGKHVLCEKAFTVNAEQTKVLYGLAKEKGLFILEAVWTRFFPLSIYVRDIITSNTLGPIHKVTADMSMAEDPETTFADGKHRMVNPALAGGTLLDLGIYSLTWLFQTLYTTISPADRKPPTVLSQMKKLSTGADGQTTILLTFPRPDGEVHAIATASLYVDSDPSNDGAAGPAARIQGEKGELAVYGPLYRPTRTRLILKDKVEDKEWKQPGPGKGSGFVNGFGSNLQEEGEGQGMFWEADECARVIAKGKGEDGRWESEVLSWGESEVIMGVMDEVRRQGGLKYPEKIESTEYPLKLD